MQVQELHRIELYHIARVCLSFILVFERPGTLDFFSCTRLLPPPAAPAAGVVGSLQSSGETLACLRGHPLLLSSPLSFPTLASSVVTIFSNSFETPLPHPGLATATIVRVPKPSGHHPHCLAYLPPPDRLLL